MNEITITRTSRILSGHPWIFSNELAESPRSFEPGSLVTVRDRRGSFIGRGYINPHSLIAVRLLTMRDEKIGPEFLRLKVSAAIGLRKRLFPGRDAVRLIFGEGDGLPGLIADKYADSLVVQCTTWGMHRFENTVLEILDDMLSPATIVLRNDSPARQLEHLPLFVSIVKGNPNAEPLIRENGVLFSIDLLSGQKTGFFLDQHDNRELLFRMSGTSGGTTGLDLFCYTGAWGLALARNAISVTFVDESERVLIRARDNAERNELSGFCRFHREDAFSFLKEQVRMGKTYDYVVTDPPAFAKSKTALGDAVRGYTNLNALAMQLVKPGGLLVTSSCSHHIDRELFVEILKKAAKRSGKTPVLHALRSQSADHPVLLNVPETEYLKCVFLRM